ncbi:MAG TPA: c-type cytochrome biogenesis protein CcmI [Beijerinckiaceae bacterium]|jgi:cytochrome c-type biogenesis protein CcmH
MAIWLIFSLMTGAAVMAVLWPLSRRPITTAADPDTQFYREQLAEIDRDLERGLLSAAEAEAARAEAARRLLRVGSARQNLGDVMDEPALRRRRAVSAIALSTIPLLALAVYGAYGSPRLPAQPLAARLQADQQGFDFAAAVMRIESHLAQHPEDGRGWEVIAPVYLNGGRGEDAVKAYGNVLRLLGENATRLASYGQALVTAAEGVVPAEARAAFERALTLEATNPKALYFMAHAAEQDGDRERARSHYAAILSSSPPDAPWVGLVRQELTRLGGETAVATITSLPGNEQQAAIRGMVESLAQRLDANGGTAEEWGRLVRSYTVLGERDKASASLGKARLALAKDQEALGRLDAIAHELAINEAGPAQ